MDCRDLHDEGCPDDAQLRGAQADLHRTVPVHNCDGGCVLVAAHGYAVERPEGRQGSCDSAPTLTGL
jgi:hypothetical protein